MSRLTASASYWQLKFGDVLWRKGAHRTAIPWDSTAQAVDDALVCMLTRRDLERLIMDFPKVGLRFLEQVSARLLETELIVDDFAFKSVPALLAGVALRLAESADDDTIEASHHQLADMIATYRETAVLTLDEFQKRRRVKLGRRGVRILGRGGAPGDWTDEPAQGQP